MTGSFMDRGNQYIQLVKVLYSKLSTNGKQLPAFPLDVGLGTEHRSPRWEVKMLPLCHYGPFVSCMSIQHLLTCDINAMLKLADVDPLMTFVYNVCYCQPIF